MAEYKLKKYSTDRIISIISRKSEGRGFDKNIDREFLRKYIELFKKQNLRYNPSTGITKINNEAIGWESEKPYSSYDDQDDQIEWIFYGDIMGGYDRDFEEYRITGKIRNGW